jgi:hypothetical protein
VTTSSPGNAAAATQLADRATAVAGTFRGVANDLLDRAQALRADGSLGGDDFTLVSQRCMSLFAQAMAIDNEAFIAIAADVAHEFSAIEDGTRELERVRARIKTAKTVIGVVTKVLTAAGAVAAAIVNPAGIPLAAGEIVLAVTAIVDAGQPDDKKLDPVDPGNG